MSLTQLSLPFCRRSGALGHRGYVLRKALEVGLLLAGLALWAMTRPVEEPVPVFPIRLDADCVRDACAALERQGLAYSVTPSKDGLLVGPDDRARAQLALVLVGLPRHRVPIRDDWGCDGGPSEELLRKRARKAEAELGQAISIFPGVQCATVKVKRAVEVAFTAEPTPNRVQVWLRLSKALPAAHSAAIGRLALIGYYDIRHPIEVEIRDQANGHLLGSAHLGYSTGPQRDWEDF